LRWRILFACVDAVGWGIARLLRVLGWHHAPHDELLPHAAREANYRNILLVQLDHLGDAILSTGLLQGLKAAYPEARIDVLASNSNAELFASLPEIDRVFVSRVNRFDRSRRFGWMLAALRWGWRLRRQRYDLAIDPRGDFPSAVILWLTRARVRLGWSCGGGGFLLTHRAEFVWDRHEVLSRQALLDQLGIAPPAGQPAWPPRIVPDNAHEPVSSRLTTRLIVLHPGAGTAAKRWPVEHWRELLGRLILEYAPQIVFVGSAEDRPLVSAILEEKPWPNVSDSCGQLAIDELARLVARADLLIGSDSGPAHLAAAVGTPVVAIFSGANRVAQWRPWGEAVKTVRRETPCSPCHREECPLEGHPCLAGLLPLSVLSAARTFLARSDVVRTTPAPSLPMERSPL
jgi:lipopolysaccharide heptosyltransferase II